MRIGLIGAVIGVAGSLAMAGGNAALVYYRAMSLGPSEAPGEVLDTSGERLAVTGSWHWGYVEAELLHEAAAMDEVDWGIDLREGPATLMPHLGMMRKLSRYLAADALARAAADDSALAAADVAAIHRMGVHVAADDILISSYVGMAIQNLGIRLTNQLIDDGKIDADGARVIVDAIRRGDSADRFEMRDAIVGEWRMLGEFIITEAPEEDVGLWLQELTAYAGDSKPGQEVLKMSRREIMRALGGFAEYHSDLLMAWDAQDAGMFAEAEERVKDGSYGALTELLGPTYVRAFAGHVQTRKDLDALVERLEGIAG